MPTKEFKAEQQWLEQVYLELDQQLEQSIQSAATYREEMRKLRTSLWEDYGISSASSNQMMDIGQQIAELQHKGGHFGIQHRLVEQLKTMEKRPYFGRMDFHEEGLPQIEAMYIGIRSLIDQRSGLPLVYDWRAPVSSMFYDFGLGKAEYEGPGGVYSGEISLKRQYKIEDRRLVYMFDNELKIDDQVLQEALSTSANEKMRTIVNTIQREQNQAIRNEQDPLLLVEGPAGSGKTSVALHRIAFLLYRYRDSIGSENIIIFSPNQIFSDYIAHVLPELGEENVDQITFQNYAEAFFNWEYDLQTTMDFLEKFFQGEGTSDTEQLKIVAFKSSQEFQAILSNLVSYIKEEATQFSTIKFRNRVVITKEEQARLFLESYTYLPTKKRLAKIRERILFLLRPLKKEVQAHKLKEVASEAKFKEESSWTIAREAVKRTSLELETVMEQLNHQFMIDAFSWYEKLWQEPELWQKIAPNTPFPKGGGLSLETLKQGFISYEDQAALLYLSGELEGYPSQREIRHLVIDEVQDYSPIQLKVLSQTFPRAKITLVGDVYQSLNPYVWQSEQGDLRTVFGDLQPTTVELTKSYRSTQEIFHFCNALLRTKSRAETVIRTGPKPSLARVLEEETAVNLAKQITKYQEAGYETIAVICPSLAQCQVTFDGLRKIEPELSISLLDHERASFQPGVIVLPVYLAKGLEFDAVILPEVNKTVYGQEYQRRLLYIACSRALHELSLFYSGDLSPFLTPLPASLYTHLDLHI